MVSRIASLAYAPCDTGPAGNEVFIRRDVNTGEVVLSAKPASWQEFFELADKTAIPSDFMVDREDVPAEERYLF